MIECSNERIWYKKRRSKRKKFFWFFITFSLLILLFLYYVFYVTENIRNYITDSCYNFTTNSVNEAVLSSLKDYNNYESFIDVEKNNSGEIVMLKANSYNVNLISRRLAELTQNNLNFQLQKGVGVPLLAFSGIGIVSGFGPTIYLKAVTVSSVECDFESNFESCGINQTLHSIYINIKTKLNIEIPIKKYEIENSNRVLVSEAVLVGKVPDAYLNGNLFK